MKVWVCRDKIGDCYRMFHSECSPVFVTMSWCCQCDTTDDTQHDVGYFCPDLFEEYTGCHLEPGEKKLMEWRLPLAEDEATVDQFCDGCIHLSPTEEEQERLPHPRPEHWCNLFNQAVKHEGRHPRIPRLKPCLGLKAKEACKNGH